MQISRGEFDDKYSKGTLHLAFIGMSNIGKSYTAARLTQSHNFDLIEVDRLIWEELQHGSMADFAKWQGQPYTDGYAAREAVSVNLETKAMHKAISGTEKTGSVNSLLDTTGSVIYIAPEELSRLKDGFLIVHIAAEQSDIDRLKSEYFARPKPLVWRGHYRPQDGMTREESVLACYSGLLAARKTAYEALADLTLESSFVLSRRVTPDMIFEKIRGELSPSA
jgi:shikimate kinase